MVQICHLSIHKVIVLGTDCRDQVWFKKRSILLKAFGVYSPSSGTLVHRRCINGSALSLASAVLTATVLILALVQLLAVLRLVTLPPLLLAVTRHTETLFRLVSVNSWFSLV